MKRIEAVYLANVIIYVDAIETIVKIMEVNKKCQEATKILRYYHKRRRFESEKNEYNNYVVVKNIFELFPNVETIKCDEKDINSNLQIFGKVKQIELNVYSNQINIPNEINQKIIQIDMQCGSIENIKLSDFPNVRKVKIRYWSNGKLMDFLGDNEIRLNQVVIQTSDRKELDCLKEYKHIDHKIIKMIDKISKERYLQLNQFADVYCEYQIDGVDIKYTLGSCNHFISIPNNCDINRLYDLTLFTKCQVENDCDLRNCELLEEVQSKYHVKNKISIQINGLKHLKIIEYARKLDCIPSSVTNLSFNPYFNYQELLKDDINCFINIKNVFHRISWGEKTNDSKVFLNFKNCTKLGLINSNSQGAFEFPTNLKELTLGVCRNAFQMNEITKLTGLKKLEIFFETNQNKEQVQEMYDKLKGLEELDTDDIKDITLPSSITYLELYVSSKSDISNCTNVKEILLVCETSCKSEVKLPNKLQKINVIGDIIVVNSNEIEVDEVILSDSLSQFCEWKSKNVIIQDEYVKKESNEDISDIESSEEEE